jgi:glycosyltransferase involved in cell wall biosynthesis
MKPASIIITRFPFSSQLGGEEIHTFMVAEYLRKIGHKVSFLTSCHVLRKYAHSHGFKTRKVFMYKPPVSFSSLLLFNLLSPILFLWSLVVVFWIRISHKNPKIYALSFTEKLLFSPWCWLFRIPMVWVEHARIGNWFHKNPWKFWYKLWATDNDVVTVSKIMKKDLGLSQFKVIPNAVESKDFSKLYDAAILPEEVLGYLREHKFDVGYVGRLSKDKGMELLIEAKKNNPNIGFITIGSGDYKDDLEAAGVRNYKYMNKEQIACFMQNINLFVLPATEVDPFGLVVLEAMSAGIPVLITDKVGIIDYLKPEVEVATCSPENFQSKLSELIKDKSEAEKIGEQGHKAVARFKITEMLEQYAKLF